MLYAVWFATAGGMRTNEIKGTKQLPGWDQAKEHPTAHCFMDATQVERHLLNTREPVQMHFDFNAPIGAFIASNF